MFAGKGSSSDRVALKALSNGFTTSNCEFSNSGGWGIYLINTSYSGSGNTFTSCALGNVGSNKIIYNIKNALIKLRKAINFALFIIFTNFTGLTNTNSNFGKF